MTTSKDDKTRGGRDGAPLSETTFSNAEDLAFNLARLMEEGSRALALMIERSGIDTNTAVKSPDFETASSALTEVYKTFFNQPAKLAEAQADLMRGYMDIWMGQLMRLSGGAADPVATPQPGDRRFRDSEWQDNPYFDMLKQCYLLTSQWAENMVAQAPGVDDHTRHKAEFYLKQLSSALSPTNFAATNPEVLRATLNSNGENLVEGMTHLLRDLERSRDMLKISQTDTNAFKVGENLANTEGAVVYENEVMQLIQYAPTTEDVHNVPILIVPPWINKFYILDLTEEKSFVRHAVDYGFTVFVVSWVNPTEAHADKGFAEYMHEGILTAAEVVSDICEGDKPHVLGYCVGGTLLGTTLAWLAKEKDQPFRTATFLTTQLDFTEPGDLCVFVDDDHIRSVEETMSQVGYLDGSRMANAFNMLRPGDLIWPYVINNYLLGKKPAPFDLLYWNQDSTRLPQANHSFYLRQYYLNNTLAKGRMTFEGHRLNLNNIKLPVYELATREDHIAPARSVFNGARCLGGKVRFVLAGSGHIAGVVNPPAKQKYQYWIGPDVNRVEDFDEWVGKAREIPGSWWHDWYEWLEDHSDDIVDPRPLGGDVYESLEPAPGSYVMMKA